MGPVDSTAAVHAAAEDTDVVHSDRQPRERCVSGLEWEDVVRGNETQV